MKDFQNVINKVLGSHSVPNALCGFNIEHQFKTAGSPIRKTNAAFLITLAGEQHPLYESALTHLEETEDEYAVFLKDCLELVKKEIGEASASSPDFKGNLEKCKNLHDMEDPLQWNDEARKAIWSIFFPEGSSSLEDREESAELLRKKRIVNIVKPNSDPLSDPAKELLLTSNILLTIPASEEKLEAAGLSPELTEKIREVMSEPQMFWFDHPVQIGVKTDGNEVIYGLRGLNKACAFEKERGNMGVDEKASCVLSVSVTHNGLHHVTKDYLEAELGKIEPLDNLDVYIFTESETKLLVTELLAPAAASLLDKQDISALAGVFGVDGEYGRHYSFLKAIAALWQASVNSDVKATFKIDLDQVFPQKVLVETTGSSAFEHFMSPLWGATGEDSSGNNVELGMIAGALVNESDIKEGLYTPDVTFPEEIPGDECVFFMSGLPMALSTAAEMGTRYSEDGIDGINKCIQRVHVTGGTNGILVNALRKHRPFTPTFIGRAEDQAYLMSVLFSGSDMHLRYLHRDGLVMRHDKHAFAGEAIESAKVGRQTGDLVRLLYFSNYARALPWPIEKTKELLDPFTGCFISDIPVTLVMIRLCVSMAVMFEDEDELADDLASVAVQRLSEALSKQDLSKEYETERNAWNMYYDILDALECNKPEAAALREKAVSLIKDCLVN